MYGDRTSTILSATIITTTSSTGTIEAPEDVGAIDSITIGGVTYEPATANTPEQNSFSWDTATGEITFFPIPPIATPAIVHYQIASYPPVLIPDAEVLTRPPNWWGEWNITGSFKRSRSFGSQPSGSFTFTTLASNEPDVREQLKNRSRIGAFGVGYSVDSIAIQRLPEVIYPGGWIQVEVSLTGRFVEELSESIKVKDAIDRDGGTVSSLAQLAGVPYSGAAIKLNQSYSTPASVTTQLGSELESRAIGKKSFVFYSGQNNVQTREWGKTRVHWISKADLLSPIAITLSGKGADYEAQSQNNQLSNEYKNTRLTLDTDANESDRVRNTSIWIDDADEFPEDAPPEFNSLASNKLSLGNLSHNFDSGGITKERTRTLYRNGTIIKAKKFKYGFTFKGSQVYDFEVSGISATADVTVNWYRYTGAGVNPQAFWGLVEEVDESYNYDQSEGYLRSVSITGRHLGRAKQEQDAIETIKAQYAPVITRNGRVVYDGNNLRAAYQWQWLRSSDTTRYVLASYLGLYPDIKRQKDDPNWVEPKYAILTKRSVAETEFSDSPDPNKPVLTSGRAFDEVKRVVVNYPDRGVSEQSWQKEFEQYTVHSKTTGSQGQDLKDSLNIGRRTEFLGRPSTHTRMEIVRPNPNPPDPKPPAPQTSLRALLNSPNNGYTPDDPENGSIQIPGVFDFEEARSCAQVALSIENTKGTETWQVVVRHQAAAEIEEGDRVHLLGKLFVVLSLEEEMAIQCVVGGRSLVTSGGVSMSLGLYLNPPVTLSFDE